jgi:hypothetical protein
VGIQHTHWYTHWRTHLQTHARTGQLVASMLALHNCIATGKEGWLAGWLAESRTRSTRCLALRLHEGSTCDYDHQ